VSGGSTQGQKRGGAQFARWLYKKPGGKARVGKSWRKARAGDDQVYVEWGDGGHSGPEVPRGTKVCTECRNTKRSCVTLA
jgi:hypothetical protein